MRVCSQCFNSFQSVSGLFCQKCGKPLPDGGAHCFQCRGRKYYFEYIRAVGVYEGTLKEAIHKFKYQDKSYLDTALSNFMVQSIHNMFPWEEIDYIVPIPLYKHNEWHRGYNQTVLLSKKLVKVFNKQMIEDNLVRNRKTKPQAELSRKNRLTNLVDAFSVEDAKVFQNRNVLLVDDVCTTGSTIDECAKVLKKSGTNKIWGITLAHGI